MSPTDRAEDLARKLAGNWLEFTSFAWHDKPESPESWAIIYTHNRDSDVLTLANAKVFKEKLETEAFAEDVRLERHGHWACGWVEGYAVRVHDSEGNLTPAFLAYAELALALENYPILDENLFSEMEQDEACEVWRTCYSDRERLDYIREHWSDFECCQAKWNPPQEAWRALLANVRGRWFGGCASELLF